MPEKNVSPAAPVASPIRMWPDELDLTEAEGYAIETLRRYQAASLDPSLLAHLQAWECLQMYVDGHRDGVFSLADALDAAGATRGPVLYSAVVTIAGLFDLFVPQIQQSEQSEGSRTNG